MSKRSLMLSSVIRDAVVPVLRQCPPECGIVSITRVDVSSDTSYATLYVSALREPELALDFLRSQTRDLQRSLSRLDRKKIPLLRFRLDPVPEQGNRIDELLGEASKQMSDDTSTGAQE